jgi:hypothetical protein
VDKNFLPFFVLFLLIDWLLYLFIYLFTDIWIFIFYIYFNFDLIQTNFSKEIPVKQLIKNVSVKLLIDASIKYLHVQSKNSCKFIPPFYYIKSI